jgi:hypothetical protein
VGISVPASVNSRKYPRFVFYPPTLRPPSWTGEVLDVFSKAKDRIDTTRGLQKKSDEVLTILRPHLEDLRFEVERGKKVGEKIQRPALFGEMGEPGHKYEVDAYRQDDGIVLEIEAGRAIKGNAIYRDLIQMSLMLDARFAIIAMPQLYRHKRTATTVEVPSYASGRRLLEAIYASPRLHLPFDGILLVGY